MVAKEFIDFFSKHSLGVRSTVEDFSDRLNVFTVVLFLLSCIVVSTKQYFMNSISCYIPVKPTGDNFNSYLSDYCWVHGTIPLRSDEQMPSTPEEWDKYDALRRINYYQWVPFVLGLQCIFFYLPHYIWQSALTNRAGGDIFTLMKSASDASTQDRASREKTVNRVAEFMEDMIAGHNVARSSRRIRIVDSLHRTGLCIASKHLGNCLVFTYLIYKVMQFVNAIIQLIIIQHFLGFYSTGSLSEKSLALGHPRDPNTVGPLNDEMQNIYGFGFGLSVLSHIRSGRDWPETLLFPRVSYCRVTGIRLVGAENSYTAQCTLPINMLNEKIYIFFWFWIVLLMFACASSFVLWCYRLSRMPTRRDLVKRYLRTRDIKKANDERITREDLKDFIDDYLRRDGVFLLYMLALNAGEIVATEVAIQLYKNFQKRCPQSPVPTDGEKFIMNGTGARPPEYGQV